MKDRKFVKIEVSDALHDKFMSLLKRRGITQTAAGTRLFDWFMDQDELVQQAILLQLPVALNDEAARQLRDGVVRVTLPATTKDIPPSQLQRNLRKALKEGREPPTPRANTG